jgi:uncharacterized protein
VKPSLYNHIVRRRGLPQVLYNSRSHRFLELDQVQAAIYGGLAVPITRNLMNLGEPAVQKLLSLLTDQGFFIGDEVDEQLQLEVAGHSWRFDPRRLSLWIQATTKCDQGCDGCPHQGQGRDFGPQGRQALEAVLARRAPGLRQLEIHWFGGEPTLAWDTVSDLNRSLAAMAARHGFGFTWSVFSNGLTHHLKTILIAPESPQRLYLNLRAVDSNEFDIQRTVLLADFGCLNKLANISPRASVRLVPNRPGPGLCRNLNGFCQAAPKFSDEELETLRDLVAGGYRLANLPRPRRVPCPAVDSQSFIIGVDGSCCKCWNGLGRPEQVLADIDDLQQPAFLRWLDWAPFRNYHCRTCYIMPWCLGGCLDKPQGDDCGQWRFSIREMLKLLVLANEKGAA